MKYTKITIKINSDDKPPYFMGSQLRGAFGYALKNITNRKEIKDNLFNKFIEQKNVIHQYRFDIRLGLAAYEFSFYLFEESCDEVFNIISTFHEMMTNVGLGKGNVKYEDFEIYLNKKLIYTDKTIKNIKKYTKVFKIPKYKKEFILRFETPLRVKKNGNYVVDDTIDLDTVLNSIYQRSLALQNKEFKRLPFRPKYTIKSKDIFFNDIKRFSNIQNSSMNFGGIMGEMWISDIDEKSFNLLKLGEIIGVGKQTVFGLGKINIGEVR